MSIYPARTYLISKSFDFWTLGGLSLIVWVVLLAADKFSADSAVLQRHLHGLPQIAAFLSLLCNYPHFMASYRLAYRQPKASIPKYWFSLMVVPLTLAVVFGFGLWASFKELETGPAWPALASWTEKLPIAVNFDE